MKKLLPIILLIVFFLGGCRVVDVNINSSTPTTVKEQTLEETLELAEGAGYDSAYTGAQVDAAVAWHIAGIGTALTALNGENIQDDTIDDDSIDFTDVTLLDFGLAVTHDTSAELDALYEAELTNSAGLLAALSDETGTGVAVFATSPTLVAPSVSGDLAVSDDILIGGTVSIIEKVAADADVADRGQIWVKTAVPNELWFTDDAGTDVQLGIGSIADDSLLEVKLDSTNAPTDNYVLSYDDGTGGFTWVEATAGAGTMTTIKENDAGVGGADIIVLDFLGADFDLAESPDTEVQVVIAAAIARSADVDVEMLNDVTGEGVSSTYPLFDDYDGTYSFRAIAGTDIPDNAIDSDHYTDASIDNEHLADDAVGTAEIATDAVTMDSIDADGVFTSLTGNWSTTGTFGSAKITSTAAIESSGLFDITGAGNMTFGSADVSAFILSGADETLTFTPTADLMTVTTGTGVATFDFGTINLATDALDLSSGSITNLAVGGLPDNTIDNGCMADNSIDSDEYVDGSIDNEHLADDAVGTAEIATDAVTMDSVDADGDFETLTGNWYTTGTLKGAIPILSYSANQQLSAANSYGVFVIGTAAMTLELPDTLAAGMSGCFTNEGGDTTIIGLNPGDSNYLVADGVVGTITTTYAATSAAGNKICWVCTDATHAYITSEIGTWSE